MTPSSSPASRIAWLVAVIALAALGVFLGGRLRSRAVSSEPPLRVPLLLAPDHLFPNVAVSGEDGRDTTTHALLQGRGAVVILIDVECRPCSLMTTRFQRLVDEHSLEREQVVGITDVGPETIRSYKRDKQLTFPIYSDPTRTFFNEYGVKNYPLRLVVGRSLTIHAATYDARQAVRPERLQQQLQQ